MKDILIIDDDPEIVDLLQQFLERQGLTVKTGGSGQDMWRALEHDNFDLVVLDVLLPGVDGLTLCRELRGKSEVPIIILTALDEETDRIVGLEIGADDYLVKPFSPRELLARMRAISRRFSLGTRAAERDAPKQFRFAGFRFDTRKRELRAPDDVIVHLSRTEFDLLRFFVQHPYEVIDRNQISEQLRGHELGPFDRSVDLHVSRLRTKMAPLIGGSDFIKTIRGKGYMFSLDVEPVS